MRILWGYNLATSSLLVSREIETDKFGKFRKHLLRLLRRWHSLFSYFSIESNANPESTFIVIVFGNYKEYG